MVVDPCTKDGVKAVKLTTGLSFMGVYGPLACHGTKVFYAHF